MSTRSIRNTILIFTAALVSLPLLFCNDPAEQNTAFSGMPTSDWLNVYDTSVHYVGIDVCKGCHSEIYQTYIQTGMGQSFDHATRQKSAGDFSPAHASVYDKDLDLYYKPYFEGDSMSIMEYRLSGGDTVHKLVQTINYIVGSGQHTNSHIYSANGYFYQAPITFYTQKHRWDLAPGFEKGASSRFGRMIETECMTCHNGYPQQDAGSQNKYVSVKTGIDCERCHGPGSLHVATKQAGKLVDTSKGPDYTIVNPRRLSTELQNNICQRCHLQGIAVLNEGKTFYDFHPGMKLSEVMNVFMPQYEGAQDKMIMASHVERMKKSNCYINSGKMSCITCHNPHVSVKATPRAQYITACNSCHGAAGQTSCKEAPSVRAAKGNDCVTCHMPHNGSIDIPHVAVTDHFIRRRPSADSLKGKIQAFLGLRCFNNDKVDAITTARSYLEFYERYNPNKGLIDSALFYLNKQAVDEAKLAMNKDYIRAYSLLKDFPKVVSYADGQKPELMKDAWTCFRAGEACFNTGATEKALAWYKRATELMQFSLDFQSKYATCLMVLKRYDESQKVYEFILSQNARYVAANTNLGWLYMLKGNSAMAYDYMNRARALDPDNEQTLINLAVWYHGNEQMDQARKCVLQLLRHHPDNAQAKQMLIDLNAGR